MKIIGLDDSNPEEDRKAINYRYRPVHAMTFAEGTYNLLYMDTVLYRSYVCAFYLFVSECEHSRFPFTRVRLHAIHLRRHVKCNGLTISLQLAANFPKFVAIDT